ncbi:MAG: hypothetical protein IJF32_04500 [Oscillospiraceae bacterium]|nr:hypothetical protein [Oscillospiraceae bacterium]
MKVCVAQPEYSTDYNRSDELFEKQLALFEQCDSSMDLIVFPESCDIPCLAKTKEAAEKSVKKYNQRLLEIASATAKRCNALLFVNARSETETGSRNTTYAFNRNGELAGKYYKQHLTPGEVSVMKLDGDYSFEFSEPTVIEIEGIRFGFLICYDAYFYEAFPNLARQNLDVIIACSHQRSDTHEALKIMSQFLAYNTNTYVIRSSVSMDVNSNIGGASMVVAPTGEVLCHMESHIGLSTAEIDVHKKYYKPAGFGNPDAAHYEYIEKGRRPWKYRPAGSAIVRPDDIMPYPRFCAHRGFNTIAPENSMPAFGAAVAMGAEEIEFDLWVTKDGEIVSCHDKKLDRVSTGTGNIYDYIYEELLSFDFGIKYGEKFKGLKILKFEDILKKLSCHTIMNIHIKTVDNQCEYDPDALRKIIALIDKYDCRKYVYFTSGNDNLLRLARRMAPDICRCVGAGDAPRELVDRAIRYDCKKIQFFKGKFDQEMIDRAHENGIICNVFWSDDEDEAREYLAMGIDTILTNDYNLISRVAENATVL